MLHEPGREQSSLRSSGDKVARFNERSNPLHVDLDIHRFGHRDLVRVVAAIDSSKRNRCKYDTHNCRVFMPSPSSLAEAFRDVVE